jgi:hypothetical protein
VWGGGRLCGVVLTLGTGGGKQGGGEMDEIK